MPDREDHGQVDLYDDSLLLVRQGEGGIYLYWRADLSNEQISFICSLVENESKRKLH